MGAVNFAFHRPDEQRPEPASLGAGYEAFRPVAKQLKAQGIGSIIVAEENYGEGSSREHAALEPRFLNAKVVLVKSFARIHETNSQKTGHAGAFCTFARTEPTTTASARTTASRLPDSKRSHPAAAWGGSRRCGSATAPRRASKRCTPTTSSRSAGLQGGFRAEQPDTRSETELTQQREPTGSRTVYPKCTQAPCEGTGA
ncbi:MAG: hypothetical protein ACLR8Y_07965 [Alistipes indistinctus]